MTRTTAGQTENDSAEMERAIDKVLIGAGVMSMIAGAVAGSNDDTAHVCAVIGGIIAITFFVQKATFAWLRARAKRRPR